MDFEAQSHEFVNWLKSNGCTISSKIALKDLRAEQFGRAVIAVDDIQQDEDLFTIPRSCLLSFENSDLSRALPELKDQLDDWLLEIIVMLYESSRPKFAPYFAVLPARMDDCPIMWDAEETNSLLKGTDILDRIGRESADQLYRDTVLPLVQANSDLFSSCDTSLEAFHRMGCLLQAYSFDCEPADVVATEDNEDEESSDNDSLVSDYEPPTFKAMVPMADMLNADADLVNANLFYESDALVMRAIKDIKANEQVYNTYGELSNAELLRRYGYVHNQIWRYDTVELPLDLIYETAKATFPFVSDKSIETIQQIEDFEEIELFELEQDADLPKELQQQLEMLLIDPASGISPKEAYKKARKLAKSTEKSDDFLRLAKEIINARLALYDDTAPTQG
ncbi:hypothetical protein CANCADRAFT_2133 [Tortispora caseinolytica NRRL Y-17796]|uniref:SET domain-containing protein n=1 Tax=Tortispora caseinolytica NRRL Y-17796 TaxID=767744 RepID=A0A1E4TFF4_9ASCO|nr:hypothetical protein CANCADRAFT_2133 [Tortispora caseinolytica NRRL Y-17796]